MSTFEVDVYARTFFPHLPIAMARQVASEAVNRECKRRAGRPYEQFVRMVNERRVAIPCAR